VSDQTDDIYIGSTCQRLLSRRLSNHMIHYHRWLTNNEGYITSFEILKHDDCQIILIENYPCSSRYELEARERYHIENTSCVNKALPTRTSKQYKEDNQDSIKVQKKQYNSNNKEHIAEKWKQYYNANKEHLSERNKQYAREHREQLNERQRLYNASHKDQVNAKHVCPLCGSTVLKRQMARHQRRQKCLEHQNTDTELN